MFPLGNLMKTDVKRIAEEQGFHAVASKPEVKNGESCFFLLQKISKIRSFVL